MIFKKYYIQLVQNVIAFSDFMRFFELDAFTIF
jgi:hypothetical protein